MAEDNFDGKEGESKRGRDFLSRHLSDRYKCFLREFNEYRSAIAKFGENGDAALKVAERLESLYPDYFAKARDTLHRAKKNGRGPAWGRDGLGR